MATAVSGSGPAYIFLIMELLIEAAVGIGLPGEIAEELVIQTVLGATRLAQSSEENLPELRRKVTSPGGTTAAGLLQLEEGSLADILSKAIVAGYKRAGELGREQNR
jgi:pyrroline-5-carboxylate reductase